MSAQPAPQSANPVLAMTRFVRPANVPAVPAAPQFLRTRVVRLILLLYAIAICCKMPQIVIKGRFWAEEGAIFYHNAWISTPLCALFISYGGYLNLIANAATLAARWLMPLTLAPYFTICTALVIQLCPPLLLLTAHDAWLRPAPVRAAGLLLLLLVPAADEIWLQTLHCQFELALCCGLILALNAEGGGRRWLKYGLLFLAPLCGLAPIALLPLYCVRAMVDRCRERLLQSAALAVGSAIQLILFFHVVSRRAHGVDPAVLLSVVTVRHLAIPFLGPKLADPVAQAIRARIAAGNLPLAAMLLPVLVFGALASAALWHRRSRPAAWLLAASMVIAGATYFGALDGAVTLIDAGFGARYVVAPQALLGLAILAVAATSSGAIAGISGLAVVWLIMVGAVAYSHPAKGASDGPAWRGEIALWRDDQAHPIEIWPKGWRLTLGSRKVVEFR